MTIPEVSAGVKKLMVLIITSMYVCALQSQDTTQINISNLPYYNFGRGVGVTSPDSIFQFNIRFRLQNRFSFINDSQRGIFTDGQIRRLRLRFDGFVGDPRFLYVIQLSFAPGDVGEIFEGENINIIRDAVAYYVFSKKINLGFGQTKLPGNRQRVNSSGALQLSDRSINNAYFNIDRDFGLFLNFTNEYKNSFSWNIKSAISNGEGRNFTRFENPGMAYTIKTELMPLGSFEFDGINFEGDLMRESKPKLMISGVYHYNYQAHRQAGVLGKELFETRNLQSAFVDVLFKYRGWSVMTAYMNRHTEDPLTINATTQERLFVFKGEGMDYQASYLFKNKFELIGRYSFVNPSQEIHTFFEKHKQYTLGVSKYFWEHAFKIQLEFNIDQFTNILSEDRFNQYLRFQLEMGI
jgi:phosphate-selective porin OprO and OprP